VHETSCTHTRWHSWGSTRRATGRRAGRRCAPGVGLRRRQARPRRRTVSRRLRDATSVAAAKLFVTPRRVCAVTSCTHTRWHSWGSTRRATGSRAGRRCAPGVGLRRRQARPRRRTVSRRLRDATSVAAAKLFVTPPLGCARNVLHPYQMAQLGVHQAGDWTSRREALRAGRRPAPTPSPSA
jgi:hypothetical protein